MSAFPPPDDRRPQTLRTFATRAQLADYLEAQAFELEREQVRGAFDQGLHDVAVSFADLARANALHGVADRFHRLIHARAKTGDG